jgi:hypothetical protein
MSQSARILPMSRPTRAIVNRAELESELARFHATYDPALADLNHALQVMQDELQTAGKNAYPTLFNVSSGITDILYHFCTPPAILKGEAITGPLPKRATFAAAGNTIALANYLEGFIRNEDTPEPVRHAAADAYIVITERLRDTDFQQEFEDLSLQLEAFCRQIKDDARVCYVAKPDVAAATRLRQAVQAARARMNPVYKQAINKMMG